jgi:hypothetical protein
VGHQYAFVKDGFTNRKRTEAFRKHVGVVASIHNQALYMLELTKFWKHLRWVKLKGEWNKSRNGFI